MSTIGIAGVTAAGMQPVWAIPAASLASANITDDTKTITLAAVTGGQKLDCFYDFGGLELTREPKTKERQRACQKVVEEIKVGETISGSITVVWDQQKLSTEEDVNKAYKALPEGEQVYLFIANGWDQDKEPTAQTVGDLWRVRISQVDHVIAGAADEDLMARATLTGDLFIPNITLTA